MNGARIYYKRTLGLDNKVWKVMIGLTLLSLCLLSYRLIEKKECIPFSFLVKTTVLHTDSVYFTGENISFESSTTQQLTWNFGDKTEPKEGPVVSHRFASAGKYYVTASISSGCVYGKEINVKTAPPVEPNKEDIISPATGKAGQEISFVCVPLADVYEWAVLYHPEIKAAANKEVAKIKFPASGTYVIEVTLDKNRIKTFKKEIDIAPDPTVAVPTVDDKPKKLIFNDKAIEDGIKAKPKSTFIADITFRNYLESFMKSQMTIEDFKQYLCYDVYETPATLNGKAMKFNALCQELMDKKRKIESVVLKREEGGEKCIIMINVKLKKGKWLGVF